MGPPPTKVSREGANTQQDRSGAGRELCIYFVLSLYSPVLCTGPETQDAYLISYHSSHLGIYTQPERMQDQQKYTGGLAKTRVLIVGGTVGIGYGVAEAALEHGVSAVSISSSQQSRVNCAVSSLEGSYPSAKGKIKGYVCDLSTEETLEENVRGLLKNVGKIDHLVYTTGDRLWTMPIDETDFAKLKQAGELLGFAIARWRITQGRERMFYALVGG